MNICIYMCVFVFAWITKRIFLQNFHQLTGTQHRNNFCTGNHRCVLTNRFANVLYTLACICFIRPVRCGWWGCDLLQGPAALPFIPSTLNKRPSFLPYGGIVFSIFAFDALTSLPPASAASLLCSRNTNTTTAGTL